MRFRDNGRRGEIHSPTNKQKWDYTEGNNPKREKGRIESAGNGHTSRMGYVRIYPVSGGARRLCNKDEHDRG